MAKNNGSHVCKECPNCDTFHSMPPENHAFLVDKFAS